jgi:multiple sugar transport system ATP-binding protein
MTELTLRGIEKQYGSGPRVLQGIDLEVKSGEFMVFVGPSGCGKSTLLRCIAGLEEVSAGQILIGGDEAQDLPPVERGVAMVFQSYALYPHMTVAENMGFALKFAKMSKPEIRAAVDRAAQVLQIGNLLERRPKELSGGQRQRVAIGRAIVRHPKVFLFDEPLSNLDASLRVQMRMELAKLHRELGTTMVYVTHDQVEAMTLGSRIAVFNGGKIEQVGRPIDLYRQPRTQFVAGFLGSPKMSFLTGTATAEAGGLRFSLGEAGHFLLPGRGLAGREEQVTLGVRSEDFTLGPQGAGIRALVEQVEYLGDCDLVHVRVSSAAGNRVESACVKLPSGGPSLSPGEHMWLQPDASQCHLFDDQGRALPRSVAVPATGPGQ